VQGPIGSKRLVGNRTQEEEVITGSVHKVVEVRLGGGEGRGVSKVVRSKQGSNSGQVRTNTGCDKYPDSQE